jgi:hypothetical protein
VIHIKYFIRKAFIQKSFICFLILLVSGLCVNAEEIPQLKAQTYIELQSQVKIALDNKTDKWTIIYSGDQTVLNILKSGNPAKDEYYSPLLTRKIKSWYSIMEYKAYDFKRVIHSIEYKDEDEDSKIKHLHITFEAMYYTTKAQDAQAEEDLNKFYQDLTPKLKGKNEYRRIKIIHDEIITQMTYKGNGNTAYSIYGALIEHEAVCTGYGLLFKRVCDYFGIPCKIVVGDVPQSGRDSRHMWNIVKMWDKWYQIDLTWDDTGDKTSYKYFLKSDSFMQGSEAGYRSWDWEGAYPKCDTNFFK